MTFKNTKKKRENIDLNCIITQKLRELGALITPG